jgi:hypothetical protein
MTGWNMPPGCNTSDIPGNRPEDQLAEQIADEIAAIDCGLNELHIERLTDLIMKWYQAGFDEGYAEGLHEAMMRGDNNDL